VLRLFYELKQWKQRKLVISAISLELLSLSLMSVLSLYLVLERKVDHGKLVKVRKLKVSAD
jgi:hypothetical protein